MVLGLSILKLFGIYENGYIFAIALITAVIDIVPVLGTGTVLIPWAIWMFFSGDVAMGIGLLVIYGVITVVRQIIGAEACGVAARASRICHSYGDVYRFAAVRIYRTVPASDDGYAP